NSEVKRNIADGSVGSPHVRVGHFQAQNNEKARYNCSGLFCVCDIVWKDDNLNIESPNVVRFSTYVFA
ncbi:hypothetical protein MSG37_08840, partial [Shewanella sp. 1CM18E]|uniref:hypothetical protein n=1 Tax=Shewanella sp. 1CM18E TaxID=2929169 RepID=UPI0020C150D3